MPPDKESFICIRLTGCIRLTDRSRFITASKAYRNPDRYGNRIHWKQVSGAMTQSVDLIRDRADLRHLFAGLIGVLVAVGVQMVQSASLTSRPSEVEQAFLFRHLAYLLIATVCGYAASRTPPQFLMRSAPVFLQLLILLLVLVLIPGIGTRVNGSQRWLRVAGLSMQPSELGRLILPLVAAATMVRLRKEARFSLREIPRTLAPLLIVAPLVLAEPDLGATLFLTTGFAMALFIGGWPLRYIAFGIIAAVPAAMSLLILKPYQVRRITGFMAAWQDLSQAPWQLKQSLLSLGSGGLHGTGIGSGWQKLSYLPEANTDFVFSVIGEELGLVGTITIIIIWMGIYSTGRASLRHLDRNSFEWVFGTSLLLQMVFQAVVNVAVVTAMIPPKGVPHPFISYGGTNLLVNVVSVGLIIGMAKHGPLRMTEHEH